MRVIVVATIALTMSTEWVVPGGKPQKGKTSVELPASVTKAVKETRPGAEIDKLRMEKNHGLTAYDIEFKAGRGEIEIAEDGTVIDIAMTIKLKDIPKSAGEAIQTCAQGARIKRIEKSEVRAEIKQGKIVKFAAPRYIYEAELVKDNRIANTQVAPDCRVIEAPRWKP